MRRQQPHQAEPLKVIEGSVRSAAFSLDGNTLVLGCIGGVVLVDTRQRTRLQAEKFDVIKGDARSVAVSPDGRAVAVGYSGVGAGVDVFDLRQPQPQPTKPLRLTMGEVMSVAFSLDGHTLAVGYVGAGEYALVDSEVVLVDLRQQPPRQTEPVKFTNCQVEGVAFGPDGRTLAVAYRDGASGSFVGLFDTGQWTRRPGDHLNVTEGHVSSVAFSPDGHTLAVGVGSGFNFASGGVVLFDLRRRQAPQAGSFKDTKSGVHSVAFSPDGQTLAVGYHVDGVGFVLGLVELRQWTQLQADPLKVTVGPARPGVQP